MPQRFVVKSVYNGKEKSFYLEESCGFTMNYLTKNILKLFEIKKSFDIKTENDIFIKSKNDILKYLAFYDSVCYVIET